MGLIPDYRSQISSLIELLDHERERCARAEGALDIAHEQLAIAQNNFEWARVRLNAVEAERAELLRALVKIPLYPVSIDREPAPTPEATPAGVPLSLGFDFEDVGDDAARRMGIDHDEAGGTKYRN